MIATGTASGKSLAYQLPVLSTLLTDGKTTALYLSPTKALAADQLRSLRSLVLPDIRAAAFDGDTEPPERDWVRAHSRLVLTNPDMLHRGILPSHARWAPFLRRLRYVVVDECHTYRGVFGSHVAHVLRRLRRICASYGAYPTFVLASATVASPAVSGRPADRAGRWRRSTDDASPRGSTAFALWEPPLTAAHGEHGAPVRRAAGAEAARLLADLVVEDARALAFVRSRRGAEVLALTTRRHLASAAPELADRVAAYRAGYLPEERRALEAALADGTLLGVAATNALELGIDIAGLDAVVLAGFPGTLASLWQQAGRAGPRRAGGARGVRGARRPAGHLPRPPPRCGLRPAGRGDRARPGESVRARAAAVLRRGGARARPRTTCRCSAARLPGCAAATWSRRGLLRHRPTGWYWTARGRPDLDIRGTGGEPVRVVEASTGRVLGTVDARASHSTVHQGAVYLHQGVSYIVDELDLTDSVALVHRDDPDWSTAARDTTDIRIVSTLRERDLGELTLHHGTVDVTNQVVSYLRRRHLTGQVLDETPLDLPRATAAHQGGLVHALRCRDRRGRSGAGRRAGRGARGRARRDRPAAAVRDLRPLGHRRGVDRAAPRHRPDDGLRLRRATRRRRVRRPRVRRGRAVAARDPGGGRVVRVRGRVPVLRAVAQVRQRQRAAGQGRRGPAARRGACGAPLLMPRFDPFGLDSMRRMLANRPVRVMQQPDGRGANPSTAGKELITVAVLGLILLAAAGVLTAAVVTSNTDSLSVSLWSVDVSNVTLGVVFVAGMITTVLAVVGLGLLMGALRRNRRLRKERRSLQRENEQLAQRDRTRPRRRWLRLRRRVRSGRAPGATSESSSSGTRTGRSMTTGPESSSRYPWVPATTRSGRRVGHDAASPAASSRAVRRRPRPRRAPRTPDRRWRGGRRALAPAPSPCVTRTHRAPPDRLVPWPPR